MFKPEQRFQRCPDANPAFAIKRNSLQKLLHSQPVKALRVSGGTDWGNKIAIMVDLAPKLPRLKMEKVTMMITIALLVFMKLALQHCQAGNSKFGDNISSGIVIGTGERHRGV
jgi:hypothetical protein